MGKAPRRRDPTFLRLAAFAGIGGIGAIATSVGATIATWRGGHPNSTFLFFGLWGLAALAGSAANVVVYFQSGDPPPRPPRGGGTKVTPFRRLERPTAPKAAEQDREAA